jgi:predicted transposase/invertase (TIGR01784 family)
MDFEFFRDDRYHRCFVLKDRETSDQHTDLDYLDLYFVELEKFEHKYQSIKTTLDRWVKFLNNADRYTKDTLPKELAEVGSIRKASERLEVMYLSKKEREYYDAQQKRYLDEYSRIQEAVDEAVGKAVKEAVEEAMEQTELNSKIEVAKNALKAGLDNVTIAQITGLDLSQIAQLHSSGG